MQNIIFYWAKNYRSCAAAMSARIVQQKRRLKHLLVIDEGLGAKPTAAGDMGIWKQSPHCVAIFGILPQKVWTFASQETLHSRLSAIDTPPLPSECGQVFYGQPLTKFHSNQLFRHFCDVKKITATETRHQNDIIKFSLQYSYLSSFKCYFFHFYSSIL